MNPSVQAVSDTFYLAFVLWREARSETRPGKVALVHSILNRVMHPKWWGDSISAVVRKPWQYSSMTDPKDPQLTKYPEDGPVWEECLDIAAGVLSGTLSNPLPGADSYYAISMDKAGNPPAWSRTAAFLGQVGNHKFYDTDGDHPDNANTKVA